MPLDSDTPNADAHLHVEFFVWERKDPVDADGKRLTAFEGKPFVRIMNPGDKTLVVEQAVRDDHKARFPRQWLAFQMAQGDGPVIGTPLEAWYEATEGRDVGDVQLAELKILKFQSCEQLAGASDMQIQRLGIGGAGLRQRCLEWLKAQHSSQSTSELDALKQQAADNQRQMDEMRAMLAEALSSRPRVGRPPKAAKGVKHHGQHAPATGDPGHI